MRRNKKKTNVPLILGALAVAGAGFYLWKKRQADAGQQILENEAYRQAVSAAALRAWDRMN